MKNTKYEYHHVGIPTNESKPGEKYSSSFKFYVTDGHNDLRIQWMRFEENSPVHHLIKSVPHVAFKVNNMDEAIVGKKVILEPYCPFTGFKAAFIEVDGAPVELIETNLSEAEIWNDDSHNDSLIFPKDN
jgi:hypothetical protein